MRLELIHPLLVHFPLALLSVGYCLRLISFVSLSREIVRICSWILLCLGVCFGWIAALFGEIACSIVKEGLCVPEAVETHGFFGYTTMSLFTAALLFDGIRGYLLKKSLSLSLPRLFSGLALLTMTVGIMLLLLTGKLGAGLVYEQGAAVEKLCHQRDERPPR